ncbi:DeoR/GlpR family DNA-binding transcription regulator [Compostibacter hankyongensis]|uniref:Transcriptional repressor AgaR n=1 Tax=Compostibacter hankyongensis TaxID=1007089 RepID=A0ABP8FRB1_9BACT
MINIAERHQTILSKLNQEGFVKVLDLCRELDVSAVTIRKDLKLLEDKGLLFRSHGGAALHNPYTTDRPVNEKEKIRSSEKSRIGAAAAPLVTADDSIIIASGTTVQAMAKYIQPQGRLTVITASLNVANELNHHPEIEVLQLGGILRKSSSSVAGPYAEKMLTDFFCSKLFLGADGIDLEFGITTTSAMEAHLNQQMMAACQKTVVLADASKFGRRGFGKICELQDIDQVITDNAVSPHMIKSMEDAGIEVTIV